MSWFQRCIVIFPIVQPVPDGYRQRVIWNITGQYFCSHISVSQRGVAKKWSHAFRTTRKCASQGQGKDQHLIWTRRGEKAEKSAGASLRRDICFIIRSLARCAFYKATMHSCLEDSVLGFTELVLCNKHFWDTRVDKQNCWLHGFSVWQFQQSRTSKFTYSQIRRKLPASPSGRNWCLHHRLVSVICSASRGREKQ